MDWYISLRMLLKIEIEITWMERRWGMFHPFTGDYPGKDEFMMFQPTFISRFRALPTCFESRLSEFPLFTKNRGKIIATRLAWP